MFSRVTAGVEAASPFPWVCIVRVAVAYRDRSDANIAVIDVPAILPFRIPAAGEGWHAPSNCRTGGVSKSSYSLGLKTCAENGLHFCALSPSPCPITTQTDTESKLRKPGNRRRRRSVRSTKRRGFSLLRNGSSSHCRRRAGKRG
jgi:hypothetical protein